MAAAVENNRDETGMRLPENISPFQVYLVGLNLENPDVADTAETIYQQLLNAGIEVLYDDRTDSAGVKFNDADLLGFPVRIVVSPRNLKDGNAEVKRRIEDNVDMLPVGDVSGHVAALFTK